MVGEGEKVLLRFPNSVKYKKAEGTLSLKTSHFIWNALAEGGPCFSCTYSDIKVQRISPETSSKVQLQIVLHNDTSSNFHFANPKGRAAQVKERDEVKDMLAQLIPVHRQKMNKDLEEKNKRLKDNPELYQLYKELVVGGIISAEEFWENRKQGTDSIQTKQDVGISSGILSELKPDMHGCNELRFNLTADSIEAIFKMYPAVKKRYVDTVPDQVTEKEFWTEFFKSSHFHRDRIQTNSSKDVFGECAKKDEQEQFKSLLENFVDPLLDFSSPIPNLEDGYGAGKKDKRYLNEPLIKQFNHQSLMVLQNTMKRSSNESQPGSSKDAEQIKKLRIREAVEYDDLEEDESTTGAVLKILEMDKFSHSSNSSNHNGLQNGHSRENESLQMFHQQLSSWTPSLTEVLTPDAASSAMADVTPGGKYMEDVGKSNAYNMVSDSIRSELKKTYSALAELLRHFWSCFPIKSPQLEEKVTRMATCLEKFRDTKLLNVKSVLPSNAAELTDHLSELIETALLKYRTWQSRRSKGNKT